MTARNQELIRFDLDIGPLIEKSKRLVEQLGIVDKHIERFGTTDVSKGFTQALTDMQSGMQALEQRMRRVQALREVLEKGGERPRLPADFPSFTREGPGIEAQAGLKRNYEEQAKAAAEIEAVEARIAAQRAKAEEATRRLATAQRQIEAIAKRQETNQAKLVEPQRELERLKRQELGLERQLASARNKASAKNADAAARQRVLEIEQQIRDVLAQQEKLQARTAKPTARADQLAADRKALEAEAKSAGAEAEKAARNLIDLEGQRTERVRQRSALEIEAAKLQSQLEKQQEIGPDTRPRRTTLEAEFNTQATQLEAERAAFAKQVFETERNIAALQKQAPEVFREVLGLAKDTEYVFERIQRIQSGAGATDVVSQYLRALEEQERVLRANRALILDQVQGDRGRAGDRQEAQRERAANQQRQALEEQRRIASQLAALDRQAAENNGRNAAEAAAIEQRRQELLDRRGAAIERETRATRQLADLDRQRLEAVRQAGGGEAIEAIDQRLAENQSQYLQVVNGGIDAIIPRYTELANQVVKINQQIASGGISEQQRNQLIEQRVQLYRQIEGLERDAIQALETRRLNEDEIRQARIDGMPLLERSLVGAFDDMFRRFQATLQFAISGALIFGVQQLARRFIETAVEVERAFADIETAFEFDVDFERGSREFEIGVNRIRLATLDLADEFNTLPTEANKAAFQMVSRFGDTTKALQALRAQLLATKVSTIDQAEVLRALSAVAENYAAATLQTTDALNISQALMEREAAAVLNYGKALDIAVLIQQKFGVETEDTLEGLARLAPAFSQLGFSMEQTAAIVASVSRELGQTGQNVAERLNRALGQLTEPGIRDGLLKLAAANENITLTFADFESGPRALNALIKGYEDLVRAGDSGAAFQLLNELGQRRELEVVAALFNTTELQDSIEEELGGAAGAAEKRFLGLNETISETLNSIASGFERLAQNVQRLGLLDPFKALLVSVDKVLVGLNNILELIDTTFTSLGGLGDALRTAFGFGISAFGVARLGGGIVNAIAQGGSRLAGGAGAANAALAAGGAASTSKVLKALEEGGTLLATQFAALQATSNGGRLSLVQLGKAALIAAQSLVSIPAKATTAVIQSGIEKVATALAIRPGLGAASAGGRFLLGNATQGAFAGQSIASLAAKFVGGLGAIVAGVIVTFTQLRDAFRSGRDALISLASVDSSVEAQVRRERDAGLISSDSQAEIRRAQLRLSEVQERQAQNTASTWAVAFRNVFAELGFDREFNQRRREILTDPVARAEFARRNDLSGSTFSIVSALAIPSGARREIIAGSEEFWREITLGIQRDILRAQTGELVENLAANRPDGRRRVTGGSQVESAYAIVSQAVSDAVAAVETAANEVDLENAQTLLTEALQKYEEFLVSAGLSVTLLEGNLETSRKAIEDARRNFSLGRASQGDVDAVLAEQQQFLISQAQRLAESNQADAAATAAEYLREADEIMLQRIALRRQAFDRQRQTADRIPDEQRRLESLIRVQDEELAYLRQYGDDDAIADAEAERADLQRQLADVLNSRATRLARSRLDLAQTSEEWFAASRALRNELERQAQAEFLAGDRDRASELFIEVQQRQIEESERALDEAKRWAIGRARYAGPINSRFAALEGEISATKIALGAALDPLQILELSIQLRELLAQRAQEQVNRLGAFLASEAGVSDSLKALKGQLVLAAAEMELASKQFGETSAEFYNAKLKIDQLKNELANNLLELEDINRRLGSDLTNDFEQAQLDLVEIAQRLKAPDLGELEKARLELEKEKGLLSAEKAFFDDRLFNLEFLKETGSLGTSAYLGALRALQSQVDTTTKQGKEIFLQIQGIIDGLTNDVSDLAFNIPTNIKLPTLFEVRRAVAADQLGVNYQDNRRQDITIEVRETVDLGEVVSVVVSAVGGDVTSNRSGAGGSSIVTAGSGF